MNDNIDQQQVKKNPGIQKIQNPFLVINDKYLNNNGFFRLRSKPSIKRGKAFKENYPYCVSIGKRQYLYSDITKKRKICGICLEIKNFDDFHKKNNLKDGVANECRSCRSNLQKEERKKLTPEQKKIRNICVREWIQKNPDRIKIHRKKSKKSLMHKIRKKLKTRFKKIILRATNKKWRNWIEEPQNKIFKTNSNLLGICMSDFIKYTESNFLPGMNWDNYGLGYGKDANGKTILVKKWQFDHIKPVSAFDLNNPEDVKQINHYTNLLPMWAEDNALKLNKEKLDPVIDAELLSKYPKLQILIK